ncbi:MAG: hypothetical protein AAFQ23_08665 [Cyanobacteria bacterium J06623_1]
MAPIANIADSGSIVYSVSSNPAQNFFDRGVWQLPILIKQRNYEQTEPAIAGAKSQISTI